MAQRVCMRLLLLPEHQPGRRDDESKGSGRSGPTRRINHTWETPNKKTQNSTFRSAAKEERVKQSNQHFINHQSTTKAVEEKALFCLSLLYSIGHTKGKVALSSETDRSTGCVKDAKTSEIMSREQKPRWAFEVLRKPRLSKKNHLKST